MIFDLAEISPKFPLEVTYQTTNLLELVGSAGRSWSSRGHTHALRRNHLRFVSILSAVYSHNGARSGYGHGGKWDRDWHSDPRIGSGRGQKHLQWNYQGMKIAKTRPVSLVARMELD